MWCIATDEEQCVSRCLVVYGVFFTSPYLAMLCRRARLRMLLTYLLLLLCLAILLAQVNLCVCKQFKESNAPWVFTFFILSIGSMNSHSDHPSLSNFLVVYSMFTLGPIMGLNSHFE